MAAVGNTARPEGSGRTRPDASFWERIGERLKRIGLWLWHAFIEAVIVTALMAVALVFVVTGSALAIIIRESLESNPIGAESVTLGLLLGGLGMILIALVSHLNRSREGFKFWPFATAAVAAVSGALAITVILIPDLAEFWNRNLGSFVLLHSGTNPASILNRHNVAQDFSDRAAAVINLALAVLLAGSVIAITYDVSPELSAILGWIGLTKRQIALAKRVRQPVRGAIHPDIMLSQMYRKEIQIDQFSSSRRLPLVNGGGHKARVKLFIAQRSHDIKHEDERGDHGRDRDQKQKGHDEEASDPLFTWEWIDGLLKSADVEAQQSLFFVYSRSPSEIICYGTGDEVKNLLNMQNEVAGHPGDSIGDLFRDALRAGDKQEVKELVDQARRILLKGHPHADVLLSTVVRKESDELQHVMDEMARNGLNRILLVSDHAPLERSIVGSAEISSFLLSA